MKYFLDTNIIIYAMNNTFPEIKEHFLQTPSQSIVIPAIVKAEIEYGARKSKNYNTTIDAYSKFLNIFDTALFNEKSAQKYGEIRAYLESIGQPIGPNDLLIAATVLAEDGILVTHNVKEFSRVPNLLIQDWTKL